MTGVISVPKIIVIEQFFFRWLSSKTWWVVTSYFETQCTFGLIWRFTVVSNSKLLQWPIKQYTSVTPDTVAHAMLTLQSASANLLSVTHCNIHLVLEVFSRQLLLSEIVFPLMSVLAKLSQHSANYRNLISFIQLFPLPIVTHLSASDSFMIMVLYKFTYLLTYDHLIITFVTNHYICNKCNNEVNSHICTKLALL